MKQILVTGGAGFIGPNFVLNWIGREVSGFVNLDKLTYARNLANLKSISGDEQTSVISLLKATSAIKEQSGLLETYQPSAVVHFAAESHVDRSIHSAEDFIQTNIVGTFNLLEGVCRYWGPLGAVEKKAFRFLHVSTERCTVRSQMRIPHFVKRLATLRTAHILRRKPPRITVETGTEVADRARRRINTG